MYQRMFSHQWQGINLFTVFDAILVEGKHHKIYSKCMGKAGSLMLDNLKKIAFLNLIVKYKVKKPSKSSCRLKLKGSGLLRSEKSYF